MFRFRLSVDKYKEAKRRMWDIYRALNSNVPDYDPFELPFTSTPVGYPSSAIKGGTVKQTGLKSAKNLMVLKLDYTLDGQMHLHTHHGYFEYVYVVSGTFTDASGAVHLRGDAVLIDGYDAHSMKCETQVGELVLLFTNDKRRAKFGSIRKYVPLVQKIDR